MNKQERRVELARILWQRREQLSPEELGLPVGVGSRRVTGLRREEVAALAGISVDWYTRLEQARPTARPSIEVVDRLVKVLRMTDAERAHLVALIIDRVEANGPSRLQGIPAVVQHVLDMLNPAPAFVLDRYWETIAWNRAACVVLVDYEKLPRQARNLARSMFLDCYVRQAVVDWEANARRILAQLRADYGQNLGDPHFAALVTELKTKSPEVRAWWDESEIGGHSMVSKRIQHPEMGALYFEQSSYLVENSPSWRLILYVPENDETKRKVEQALSL